MDQVRTSGFSAGVVAQVDSGLAIHVDNTATGNQPLYVGVAEAGSATSAAAWMIKKLSYDANGVVSSITWANVFSGQPSCTEIWDNRAALVYT